MDEQFRKEDVGFCSEDLVSKLQLLLKEQYGKEIDRAEAQQIGLRIAELVFIKERRKWQKSQA